jgi:hypothetical protein
MHLEQSSNPSVSREVDREDEWFCLFFAGVRRVDSCLCSLYEVVASFEDALEVNHLNNGIVI